MKRYLNAVKINVSPIIILAILNSLASPLQASKQGQDMPGLREEGRKLCSSSIRQEKKLADIRELRRHFNKGNLEITPDNHEAILKLSYLHEPSFNAYDKGVIVKGWKDSSNLEPLLDVLLSFSDLKIFKLGIDWDGKSDVTNLISKSIQFYENLEELDVENCHLTDADIEEIREAVAQPQRLKILNVRNNAINETTLKKLQVHFVNLTNLQSDISLPTILISPPSRKSFVVSNFLEECLNSTPKSQEQFYYGQAKQQHANKSYDLARVSYEMVAQGRGDAQNTLGRLYRDGLGGPKDYVEARVLYKRAADQENPEALNNLGALYHDDLGGKKNYLKAKRCFERAAGYDNSDARANLGVMYKHGQGVPQNDGSARLWFQASAAQGNVTAQANLGWYYRVGLGGPKDYDKARFWFEKAIDKGNKWAQEELEKLNLTIQAEKQEILQSQTKIEGNEIH